VIIDLCKQHGIWFDRDELSRIIQFINAGGLDASRSREKSALEEERRRLRQEQLTVDKARSSSTFGFADSDSDRINGIASAGGLLKFLLG
jgi:Zn-finger nucleic acid-binding protein